MSLARIGKRLEGRKHLSATHQDSSQLYSENKCQSTDTTVRKYTIGSKSKGPKISFSLVSFILKQVHNYLWRRKIKQYHLQESN